MIVAKARMSDGFCYISWDKDRHKLVKTVLRKKFLSFATSGRQRSKNIGEKYIFETRSPQLQLPHQANHVFLSYRKTCDQSSKAVRDSPGVVDLYDILIKQSHQKLKRCLMTPNK